MSDREMPSFQIMKEALDRILSEEVKSKMGDVEPTTEVVSGTRLDSLDIAEIVTAIEDEFDIEFPKDTTVEESYTFSDLHDTICVLMQRSLTYAN